jgi:hypothetical protein
MMAWNKIESRAKKGEQKILIKLPNNTIMRARFTNGELEVYDQINDRYVKWDDLKRGIEWKPVIE